MKDTTFDERITRKYFSFPAYLAFVFLLAVVIALPPVLYGGSYLILEQSGVYLKWYFLYCIIIAAGISAALSIRKYLSFDRHIQLLSHAAKQVAEGD
ncbi:MAG: hypothetical protein ACI4PQ_02455, partial [Butyricicoccaceae bacterium]